MPDSNNTNGGVSKISINTTLRHSPAVAWQRMGDEVVVLDVPRRSMLGLNKAGSIVWESLSREQSIEVGASTVARQFDCAAATVIDDALEFANELLQRDVLVAKTDIPEASNVTGREHPDPNPNGEPFEAYAKPAVAWEERLDESGVFSLCGKISGELEQCNAFPVDS